MQLSCRHAFVGRNNTTAPVECRHNLPLVLQRDIPVQIDGIHAYRAAPADRRLRLCIAENVQPCCSPALCTRRSISSSAGRRSQLGKAPVVDYTGHPPIIDCTLIDEVTTGLNLECRFTYGQYIVDPCTLLDQQLSIEPTTPQQKQKPEVRNQSSDFFHDTYFKNPVRQIRTLLKHKMVVVSIGLYLAMAKGDKEKYAGSLIHLPTSGRRRR